MGKVFSLLALILGLIGLFFGWLLLIIPIGVWGALILPILAIIFAIIGLVKEDSKGMAIAGLILGIFGVLCGWLLGPIIFGLIFALFGISLFL